jgi:hypothetical protein
MREPWTPRLRLQETDGGCRLSLDGVASGEGATMQAAADVLVSRLLELARIVRQSGFTVPDELGPPDLRLFAFMHELAHLAARGGDVRRRLFGGEPRRDQQAA